MSRNLMCSVLMATFTATIAFSQEQEDIRQLKLKDWQPRSMLVTKATKLEKPAFPAIDVHNHLGGGKQTLTPERVAGYLAEMDAAGVRTVVNLDGGWGDRLKETLAALDEAHPDRFLTFALIDFGGIDDEGWTEREAKRLEESFKAGAKGLKFHKTLGLGYRYKDGKLMPVDDPKLAPLFNLCAKYKRPVMIHTADPAAFFTPLDRFNERWHELNQHPNWLFYGDKFPKREDLLKQFIHVVQRHPNTTFIGAHFGNNVEDLATVGEWLDKHPGLPLTVELAALESMSLVGTSKPETVTKLADRLLALPEPAKDSLLVLTPSGERVFALNAASGPPSSGQERSNTSSARIFVSGATPTTMPATFVPCKIASSSRPSGGATSCDTTTLHVPVPGPPEQSPKSARV